MKKIMILVISALALFLYGCTQETCADVTPVCGDGVWCTATEECDGTNPSNGVCTSCRVYCNSGYVKDSAGHACVTAPAAPVCGNGIVETGETCDGGSRACTTGSGYSGTQNCAGNCGSWLTCTTAQRCGDSIVNGAEQCDDANTNANDGCDACQTKCIENWECGTDLKKIF